MSENTFFQYRMMRDTGEKERKRRRTRSALCERKSKGGWKPFLPFEPRLSTENNIVKAIRDHCNVLTTTLREIVIEPSTWFESFHSII